MKSSQTSEKEVVRRCLVQIGLFPPFLTTACSILQKAQYAQLHPAHPFLLFALSLISSCRCYHDA